MAARGEVDEAAARGALARVLASDGFRASPRLAAFLGFVVERTLAGESGALKGYTIATGALGRPAAFDPQADPIVRVEAGRLRRALAGYYAGPGHDDPVIITVPRGRYVPRFEPALSRAAAPAPHAVTSRGLRSRAAAMIGFALGVLAATVLPPRDLPNLFALAWQAQAFNAPSGGAPATGAARP